MKEGKEDGRKDGRKEGTVSGWGEKEERKVERKKARKDMNYCLWKFFKLVPMNIHDSHYTTEYCDRTLAFLLCNQKIPVAFLKPKDKHF